MSDANEVDLLLVPARACAAACWVHEDVWRRWDAAGLVPAPALRKPGATRWAVADLRLWVELCCPAREEFEVRRDVLARQRRLRR